MKIGDILGEWDFNVEAGKVAEFGRAVHDIHAGKSEFAPPTFPVVVSADFVERLVVEILGLDRKRTVHGEQGYEYFEPIRVGDKLHCIARLAGDEVKTGKRGGQMRVVTTEVDYVSVSTGKLVCRDMTKSIETGVVPA